MAGALKKVAKKKKEESNNNKDYNQEKPLNSYQREMQRFKEVCESVGLRISVPETTEASQSQQDPTISVTFLNDFRNSRLK